MNSNWAARSSIPGLPGQICWEAALTETMILAPPILLFDEEQSAGLL